MCCGGGASNPVSRLGRGHRWSVPHAHTTLQASAFPSTACLPLEECLGLERVVRLPDLHRREGTEKRGEKPAYLSSCLFRDQASEAALASPGALIRRFTTQRRGSHQHMRRVRHCSYEYAPRRDTRREAGSPSLQARKVRGTASMKAIRRHRCSASGARQHAEVPVQRSRCDGAT